MIKCPVCKREMDGLETDGLFACAKSIEKLDSKELISTRHALCFVKKGKVVYQTIELIPYIFHVHDEDDIKQTRISKVLKAYPKNDNQHVTWQTFGNKRHLVQELIVLPKPLNVDWSDKDAVVSRLKMYMLFS